MNLSINDIVIILGLDTLDQHTINTLTDKDIKKCYHKVMKIYHPDTNTLEGVEYFNDNFSKIINEAYNQALFRVEDLRKTITKETGFHTFNYNNYPIIFLDIISTLCKENMDFLFVLRSLRALDTGMVLPSFLKKIGNCYGNDFYNIFITTLQASEVNNTKLIDLCTSLMESHIFYLKDFELKAQQIVEYEKHNKR